MNAKKLPLVSGLILPCISIIVTIVLFFVFHGDGEYGALFYFNMVFTCILEAIFFGYLNLVRMGCSKMSGAMYSIMGIYSLYYIIASVIIMLSYALILSLFIPLKFYIAIIIVMTLLWVILGALLVETGSSFKESSEKIKTQGHTLSYFLKSMELLEKRYMTMSSELSIPYKSESYRCELSRLSTKIKSLMPNVFANDMAQDKLQDILDRCASLLNEIEIEVETDRAKTATRVKHFVDSSIDEIELLKTLTRK